MAVADNSGYRHLLLQVLTILRASGRPTAKGAAGFRCTSISNAC